MVRVADIIAGFDQNQQEIAWFIHEWLTLDYDLFCKIKYKIPFYYQKSWICYVNPVKYSGIELCFMKANKLTNEQGLLESKGRKYVAGITMYTIDHNLFKKIRVDLLEALDNDLQCTPK